MDGMLSQEEINALLNGMGGEDAAQDTASMWSIYRQLKENRQILS